MTDTRSSVLEKLAGDSLLKRWIRDHLDYPHQDWCLAAPADHHLEAAAKALFDRYAKMIEMARNAGSLAQGSIGCGDDLPIEVRLRAVRTTAIEECARVAHDRRRVHNNEINAATRRVESLIARESEAGIIEQAIRAFSAVPPSPVAVESDEHLPTHQEVRGIIPPSPGAGEQSSDLLSMIDAIIADKVYVDNDGVAGISCAAEAIVAALPGAIQDWITYADRLEKVLEIVAGSSTDALKRSQAKEGLRLVRPSSVSSTTRETPAKYTGTFLGYRNPEGHEMHCANAFCPHQDKCHKGCVCPVAIPPAHREDGAQ